MKREWENQPLNGEFEEFQKWVNEEFLADNFSSKNMVFLGDSSTASITKSDFDKVLTLHKKQYYHHGYFQFIISKKNFPCWYVCSKKPIIIPEQFQRFYEDFDIMDKSWEFMRKKV